MNVDFHKIKDSLRLPSPPSVLARLLKMLAEDRSSAAQLAEIILEDPGLTARILRQANSPYYGFGNKIVTVSHAIALLGCQNIRILCASEAFLAIFPRSQTKFQKLFTDYCRHSVLTALLAKILGERLEDEADAEKYFIAGLLHDIGKPVLWYNFPEQADLYLEMLDRGAADCEIERLVYGIDHAEVGSWVVEEWGLDTVFAKAVAHHHDLWTPARPGEAAAVAVFSPAKLVGLANLLAGCLDNGGREPISDKAGEVFFQRYLPGLEWSDILAAIIREATAFGLEISLVSPSGSPVEDENEEDKAYEDLMRQALNLFRAYDVFLENFKISDVFAGIRQGLSGLAGVKAVQLLLYRQQDEILKIQDATDENNSSYQLKSVEVEALQGAENLFFYFSLRDTDGAGGFPGTRFTRFAQSPEADDKGVFLPVFRKQTLLGGFLLHLSAEAFADSGVFQEIVFGYAVQMALAIRFYRLGRQLQTALDGAQNTGASAIVLAQAMANPLARLRENVYMLEQEGRNGGFARTGYRHIYCQKMRRALDEIASLTARFGADL